MATLADLMPQARALSRAEKQELVRALNEDLIQEDELLRPLLAPGPPLEVWSPYDAYEAAADLQRLLDAKSGAP
jgi:hypothetical protein